MRRKWLRLLVIEIVVLLGLWWWSTSSPSEPKEESPDAVAERELVPDGVVQLEEWVGPQEVDDVGSDWFPEGALPGEVAVPFASEQEALAWIDSLRGLGVGVKRLAGLDRLWLRFEDSAAAEAWLREQGLGEGDVAFNYPVSLPANPVGDEPVEQIMEEGFFQSLFDALGMPADNSAWGEGTLVAVLDTGVVGLDSLAHTSLEELALLGAVDTSTEAGSHGTTMAHLIAGVDNFARGVAPAADLLSVPVLDAAGEGTALDVAAGIVAAVDEGAQVINLSLGAYGDSQALADAVAYAEEAGVILVAAAGNDGEGVMTYPAGYDSVIGVGASNPDGERSSFSNYGEGLTLLIPGNGLLTMNADGETVAVTGTSGATALVSGVVAWMLAENPTWGEAEVVEALQGYSIDIGPVGYDTFSGAGVFRLQ